MHKLLVVCLLPILFLSACSSTDAPAASATAPAGSEVAMPTARQVGLSGR